MGAGNDRIVTATGKIALVERADGGWDARVEGDTFGRPPAKALAVGALDREGFGVLRVRHVAALRGVQGALGELAAEWIETFEWNGRAVEQAVAWLACGAKRHREQRAEFGACVRHADRQCGCVGELPEELPAVTAGRG